MINMLSGNIAAIKDGKICLMVGPIGLQVHVASSYGFAKDQTITLFTYLQWNQDQGPSLYGFITELERTLFELIISCSGIGPKIGLAILSKLQPNDFIEAIQTNDCKTIISVNGIGAKKAEQMIIQLRDKVSHLIDSGIALDPNSQAQHYKTIADVLQSLNYSRSEIANALDYVKSKGQQENGFDYQLRIALSYLSKQI